MIITKLIFFFSLAICLYVYFGYPLVLAILGAVRRRQVLKKDITPFISVIIPVHNEEENIAKKLKNTLYLDYPRDQLEIIVANDGSTDATEEIVSRHQGQGVVLLSFLRCGKAYALNRAVSKAKGEIIVFTDANALLNVRALRELVSNFSDPEVGGVCGNQKYCPRQSGDNASEGEDLYWTYDKFIKRLESQVGNTIAADGSIYAIRKDLFVPMADPAQADDFAISARVVTQGYRLIFEPEAISYEDPPASSEREFCRKVRVANHCMRGILNLSEALNPWRYGFYSIELLSHKVVRYLVPIFLLISFASNVAIARESDFYQLLLLGQSLFYGSALTGYLLRHMNLGRIKTLSGPFYFCLANTAAFLGVVSLLAGRRIVTWQPQRE